jgi:hypothetical protein
MVWRLSKFTTQSRGDAIVERDQFHVGDQTAPRSGQPRHDDKPDPVDNRVAGQDEHGPVAPRADRKPDLTALH